MLRNNGICCPTNLKSHRFPKHAGLNKEYLKWRVNFGYCCSRAWNNNWFCGFLSYRLYFYTYFIHYLDWLVHQISLCFVPKNLVTYRLSVLVQYLQISSKFCLQWLTQFFGQHSTFFVLSISFLISAYGIVQYIAV